MSQNVTTAAFWAGWTEAELNRVSLLKIASHKHIFELEGEMRRHHQANFHADEQAKLAVTHPPVLSAYFHIFGG